MSSTKAAKKSDRVQISIRLSQKALDHFKAMSEELGVSHQALINLYLVDCAMSGRKLEMTWIEGSLK